MRNVCRAISFASSIRWLLVFAVAIVLDGSVLAQL
jgi:hypothetical protein